MIKNIYIKDYKGISETELEIRPLTILTGLNSTGKSTCFQAVLTALYNSAPMAGVLLDDWDFAFSTIRNKNNNAKELAVTLMFDNMPIGFVENEEFVKSEVQDEVDLEKNVFYLNANRLGFDEMETVSPKYKVGMKGEYIFGTYEKEKSIPVEKGLCMLNDSETLSSHVNYWLSYILGIKSEMRTEAVTSTKVKIVYKSDDIPNLSPKQLGVGVSYLAKILIMCLRTKKGDVLMIENPEIHLHPAAQARLGEFFTYIVNAGIQLLVETHCEHMINKIQYEIYKDRFPASDVVIYYKGSIASSFEKIEFNKYGKYDREFPEGFFDATLEELMEIE